MYLGWYQDLPFEITPDEHGTTPSVTLSTAITAAKVNSNAIFSTASYPGMVIDVCDIFGSSVLSHNFSSFYKALVIEDFLRSSRTLFEQSARGRLWYNVSFLTPLARSILTT